MNPKLQTIILIIIFILISHATHAQVVIKEKVEIDFSKRNAIQLLKSSGEQTPFYGDVTIGFNCTAGGANTKVILRVGDASKRVYPGWEPQCRPGYPWYCNGWMYDGIENQPAFSPVSIEMEACKTITGNPNDTQWHTLPVTIGDIANNSAPVYAYINYPDTPAVWPHVANLGFVEKIPPDCNIPYDDCNTDLYLPDITLNQVPNGYSGRDICEPDFGQLEGTNAFWTDPLYTFDLNVCYSTQRQKLWFNITDNHTLKINFSLAICEDHIPPGCQLIYDWRGLPETLNCEDLENIMMATYGYGTHTSPCYYFRNIITAHEMEHIRDYQAAIDKEKINFYRRLDEIVKQCTDFDDPDSAKNYYRNKLENEFIGFKSKSRRAFNTFVEEKIKIAKDDLGYEHDVQSRFIVRNVIANEIYLVNNFFGCLIQPNFN